MISSGLQLTYPLSRSLNINLGTYAREYTYTKKRRLRYCSSTREGLRTYPFSQINNNETYADMTKRRLLKTTQRVRMSYP